MQLFTIREYRLLFSAQVIALFGTGLATVSLALLAYELAGPRASAVLATALTIKMVLYVVVAPVAAAYVDRLPRRSFLVALDLVRALVVLALPFVTDVWQIYFLVALLQAASAAFTPTFQAVIPDIVRDEKLYTRALSASQVAYTMESLLSPVLAAVALTVISFNWLFVVTSVGFFVSAILVLVTEIPGVRQTGQANIWHRATAGLRVFVSTASLRGIMAFNLVVSAAGAIVVVNTVNFVLDDLGGQQSDVAWLLAASGAGTLLVAVLMPQILDRVTERTVMRVGAVVQVVAVAVSAMTVLLDVAGWISTAVLWGLIGAGMAMVITPEGKVLRSSARAADLPAVFAAQFSLSHVAWLITYPVAGFLGTAIGLPATWAVLAVIALVGATSATLLWPSSSRSGAEAPTNSDLDATTAGECTLLAGQCACVRAV